MRLTHFISKKIFLYQPELMYHVMVGRGRDFERLQFNSTFSEISTKAGCGVMWGPDGMAASTKKIQKLLLDEGHGLPMTLRLTDLLTVWKCGNSLLTSHL